MKITTVGTYQLSCEYHQSNYKNNLLSKVKVQISPLRIRDLLRIMSDTAKSETALNFQFWPECFFT